MFPVFLIGRPSNRQSKARGNNIQRREGRIKENYFSLFVQYTLTMISVPGDIVDSHPLSQEEECMEAGWMVEGRGKESGR